MTLRHAIQMELVISDRPAHKRSPKRIPEERLRELLQEDRLTRDRRQPHWAWRKGPWSDVAANTASTSQIDSIVSIQPSRRNSPTSMSPSASHFPRSRTTRHGPNQPRATPQTSRNTRQGAWWSKPRLYAYRGKTLSRLALTLRGQGGEQRLQRFQVLAQARSLFDEPGTPALRARLPRPIVREHLEAIAVLAAYPTRMADVGYEWTRFWEEDGAKKDGTIVWDTKTPESWDEVILQGPHFFVATPFYKQPNQPCTRNLDYTAWDLENLPESVIPRTNYQRACDRATYDRGIPEWFCKPATEHYRLAYRRMTQPSSQRSVSGALVPPGVSHVNTVHTLGHRCSTVLVALAAPMLGLTADHLVAMHTGQMAVLRKYVYGMWFDANGRLIARDNAAKGARQRPADCANPQANLDGEDPEDLLDRYTPPFRQPDREDDMRAAYAEFKEPLGL